MSSRVYFRTFPETTGELIVGSFRLGSAYGFACVCVLCCRERHLCPRRHGHGCVTPSLFDESCSGVQSRLTRLRFLSSPADASYVIPIACSVWYADHPEVMFTPGPFYLGKTWYGYLGAFTLLLHFAHQKQAMEERE